MASAGGLTRKSTKKDDVEALLSDLDRLDTTVASTPPPAARHAASTGFNSGHSTPSGGTLRSTGAAATTSSSAAKSKDDAQSLLADLDDLVKQRRVPTPKRSVTGSLTGGSSTSRPSSSLHTPGVSGTATPVSSTSGIRNRPSTDAPLPVPTDTLSADGGASVAFAAASSEPLAGGGTHVAGAAASVSAGQQQGSWGSWWNSATKLADQARAELEKRAAQVQTQVAETTKAAAAAAAAASSSQDGDQARGGEDGGGGGGVTAAPWHLAQNVNAFLKSHGAGDLNKLRADIGKVGMKRWNEILNVVVPPIESHEVLSITLSHDMLGFDGVPDVVFQVLQRQMETHASSQNAEQQIVVNKSRNADVKVADAEADTGEAAEPSRPDMRPIVGFAEAWKLADTKLDELIAAHGPFAAEDKMSREGDSASNSGITLPITTRPLFIRIQPVLDFLPGVTPTTPSRTLSSDNASHLYIALVLRDPTNKLTHRTVSQPLLKSYALLPFEQHPWAEDLLSDSLQGALSNLGLEYVRSRMQAQSEALSQAAAHVGEGGRTSLDA